MESLGRTENRKKAGLQFYNKTNKNTVRASARKKKKKRIFKSKMKRVTKQEGTKIYSMSN